MLSRTKVYRIAAIAILLLTGVELIACEVISPETCEIFGTSTHEQPDSGDACLCCCSHIVVAQTMVFETSDDVVALISPPPLRYSSVEAASIYHPPKA